MKMTVPRRPWWELVLRGEERGLLASSVRQVARLGSLGYGLGIKSRDIAYRKGWLASKRLPQPTICVGNITTGGTGKTPIVARLATDLLSRGLTPGILLRGYKRERKSQRAVLVRDPKRIFASVKEAGDEALELAQRLAGAYVGVGADRYAVGRFLLGHGKIDCFILDDGFQHHRLARDINIVAVDVSDPWGGGQLLPAGLLREPPQALRRADAVILTRAGSVGPDRLSVLREEVSQWLSPQAALMESRHEPRDLIRLRGHQALGCHSLKGQQVLVVSAIGNPGAFELTLSQLGAQIVDILRLPDHGGQAEVVWSWAQARQNSKIWLVMTEKDAVRWADEFPASISNTYALRMDLSISDGQQYWRHLLDLIERLVHAK